MINANELRRGNLVDYTGSFLPIDSIAGDETVRLLVNGSSIGCFFTHLIDPIPLTPEILEKLGFVKTYAKSTYKKEFAQFSLHFLVVTLSEDKNVCAILDEYTGMERLTVLTGRIVQYVHQLQNVFYALTGNELEINDL